MSATRSGRIAAVTGPEIDGSHVYRFEKVALIKWRKERVTFGEAMALLNVSKATLDRWAKQGKLTPLEDMDGKQRWFARREVEQLVATQNGVHLDKLDE
jgi:excisionase family DNA binding protein